MSRRIDLPTQCLMNLLIGLLMAASCVVSARGQEAQQPVQSGCEVDYPPFCIVHDDGRADGFAVELMRAALAKMGREVTFRTGPWEEVRGWLERDEIDALPLVGRTPEREKLFDFTIPYLTMHGAIVVRADTTDIHSMTDLRGRTVGVMHTDNAEEFLRRKERGLDILTTPTFSEALQALAQGRCDAVVMQRLVAIRLLEETGLTEALRIVKRPIAGFAQDFCFAVTEGDRDMLSVLNEGLALCMADGTHRRLHVKWFAHLQLPVDRPIVVGGGHNYPPFEFLDEKGRPVGYNVDLIRAVAEAAGLEISIRLGPWSEMMNALDRGQIDAVQGMLYSPERDWTFDFSQAHLVNHCVSVVHADAGKPPSSVDELRGKRIVVQQGDIMHDFCLDHGLTNQLAAVDAQEDALRALASGKHDCALVARMTALYWVERQGWDNLVIGQTPLASPEYCFAVPEGDRALLAQLGEGLTAIADSGQYRRIHEEWMGVYGDHFMWDDVLKYVVMVAAPLLLIAVLALFWSWCLRRQVAARTRELQQKETFVRTVLDNLPVGVAVNSVEPAVPHYMNDLFPQIYRTTREALSAPDAFWDVVYEDPEFRETMRARVEADCASGEPARMVWEDVPIVRRGEPTTYISARNTPIKGTRLMISSVSDVTERKRNEEKLAAQFRLLQVAGETARFGGWSVDLETGTVTWSDLVCDIHGMPRGYSPKVEDGVAFYAPEWREKITQVFTACAEDGVPYDEEMQIVAANGRRVWVRTAGQPIKNERGKIVRVEGAFQDISERKAYENRLQHLLQVLRAVRNVNQLITHEKAQDTLLRRACEILTETRGYRSAWIGLLSDGDGLEPVAESGIGDAFSSFSEQTKSGDLPECCRRALDCNEPVVMHGTQDNCKSCPLVSTVRDSAALAHALRHGDRDYGVIVVALPAEMADDEQEQALFAELASDIGYALHSMEIERARKQAEAAKAEQQELLEAIYRNAPLIMMVVDEERRVQQINGFATQFADRSSEEMLGLRGGEALRCLHALDDPRGCGFGEFCEQCTIRNTVLDTLATGATHLQVEADYYPQPTKDRPGAMKLLVSSAPLVLKGKRMALVTLLDVSERRKLESQLRQAQKMEAVGRLAGGVAHDYNNIVMGILNYAELCRDGLDAGHPIRQWLDEITNEAQRSANLTRQLLAFARKQTIAPQMVDLNDAVGNMLKMLRRLIGEDVDLAWEPGADLWEVHIDPGQVDQILANLCVNARDAIEGTGKVTIETENVTIDAAYCADHKGFKPGDFAMLAVSDDGCGMDRETLDHVFEPFYTTKGIGEGTGLGLATVYGIAKQNDGFVNVYSEPGKGTTFRIYLPRFESGERKNADREEETETIGGNETILLVEDEKSIRLTMRLFLEKLGYTVLAAENPEKARTLLDDHASTIDLLITDVVMPGMSGRELAESLTPDHPDMRVLYMSGYTANVIAHRGVLEDGVDFLSKPITQNQLARKVREVLDRRGTKRS